MKSLLLLCGVLFWVSAVVGQSAEFAVNKNGLIYSEYTVRQLKHIVDSLNLRFRRCELQTVYAAVPQGRPITSK